MIPDEEIISKAKQEGESNVFCPLTKKLLSNGVIDSGYEVGFIEGAKWAEQFNSKSAKADFVNKAERWLKNNAEKFVYLSAHTKKPRINENYLAKDFVKAMEE